MGDLDELGQLPLAGAVRPAAGALAHAHPAASRCHCRLAQREGDRLLLTIAGLDAHTNIADVWRRLVTHVGGRRDFDRAAFETVMLTVLATGDGCSWRDAVEHATVALGEAGWRTGPAGDPPTSSNVAYGAGYGKRVLHLLGGLVDDEDWTTSVVHLTPAGRALVLGPYGPTRPDRAVTSSREPTWLADALAPVDVVLDSPMTARWLLSVVGVRRFGLRR